MAFFESAIAPEKEDEDGKEHDESAGVVELYKFDETSDCRFGVSLGP